MSKSESNPKPTLQNNITLQIAGADHTVFMSYGLKKEILRHVGGLDNVANIFLDMDLQEAVLKVVLSERDGEGKVTTTPNIDAVASDDINRVLEWVVTHVTDFFITSLETLKRVDRTYKDRVQLLGSSEDGSKG